jgi:SAM-dependent methyltransferase
MMPGIANNEETLMSFVDVPFPRDPELLKRVVALMRAKGHWHTVARLLAVMCDMDPADFAHKLKCHNAFVRAGDRQGAAGTLQAAVEICPPGTRDNRVLARLLEQGEHWQALAHLHAREAEAAPGNWRRRLQQNAALQRDGDVPAAADALLLAVEACPPGTRDNRVLARLLEQGEHWQALAHLHAQNVRHRGISWRARLVHLVQLNLSLGGNAGHAALSEFAAEASVRTSLWRTVVDHLVKAGCGDTLIQFTRNCAGVKADLGEKIASYLHQKQQYDHLMRLALAMSIPGWNTVNVDLCRMESLENAGCTDEADKIELSLRGRMSVDASPSSASPTSSTLMFRNAVLLDALVACLKVTVEHSGTARIHVAAVSTGEEVYSLVIAVDQAGLSKNVELTASDVSAPLLKRARTGVLDAGALPSVPEHFRELYFTRQRDQRLRLKQEYLASIDFRLLDLTRQPNSGDTWDVVVANNVLVHFPLHEKRSMLRSISEMTHPDGVLCIGGDNHVQIEDDIKTLGLLPISSGARDMYNAWHIQRNAWYINPRPYWALPPYRESEGCKFATLFAFGEANAHLYNRRIEKSNRSS